MRRLAFAVIFALIPAWAWAQLATLVADRVDFGPDGTLTASGSVEILFEDSVLSASRLTYRGSDERLVIEGPLILRQNNDVLVFADQAELDADLKNGILQSARVVLDQQLQLAAIRAARVDGRYTQLDRVVASSCEVCANRPTPTWEIRARSVIHDAQEQQLYFDNAQLRFLGLPVLWVPRLRLPDPSVRRARGFLIPSARSTSQLGFGLKLPYFIPLTAHADLTVTPYLSAHTGTIELRYRQELRHGTMTWNGALSADDLTNDAQRGYLFGQARFNLPHDFLLRVDIEAVSDEGYLLDYGYSDKDRLENIVRLERVDRNSLFNASLSSFRTLRDSEVPIRDELPKIWGFVEYEQRIAMGKGEVRLGFDGASLYRDSNDDIVGRDSTRLGLRADYHRRFEGPLGLIANTSFGVQAIRSGTQQDSRFDAVVTNVTPRAQVTLRWPFQKTGPNGVQHLLEPIVAITWSGREGDAIANEDSTLVEFDEGNLFAYSRFPGIDATEQGLRTAFGVNYRRIDPQGRELSFTLGRVIRQDTDLRFGDGTGIRGKQSDWLLATQYQIDDRFHLTNRAVFDDDFSFSRNATRLAWANDRFAMGTSYLWMDEEITENRPDPTHELSIDAVYRINDQWTAMFDGRFDLTQDAIAKTGAGLSYQSECIAVDFSVSRRFTTSANVRASTEYNLNVDLIGFGSAKERNAKRRSCRG